MILVTGAGGKTGLAAVRALARRNVAARAFTRTPAQAQAAVAAGAADCITGDLLTAAHIKTAMKEIHTLYLIAPNVHPQEFELCIRVLEEAKAAGITKVVYHSVLHPQLEAMPHHWQKLRVEEALIESGLDFVILQPCAYMQNVIAHLPVIRKTGRLEVPYDLHSRHSLVDLEDVAEAAAETLTGTFYNGGTYELAGPELLNHLDIAAAFALALERPVEAKQISAEAWGARSPDLDEYSRETLLAMFRHYDQFGYRGSSVMLQTLLHRSPGTFAEALARAIEAEEPAKK